jgi:predicted MFS family arabinose efflux permease
LCAAALALWLRADRTAPPSAVTRPIDPGALRNRQLIATDAVGLCVLFTQVTMFTYVRFTSERLRTLTTAALGWLFVVLAVAVPP